MNQAIKDMVEKCVTCAKLRPEPKEPLMPSELPSRPWERVASDLFELEGKSYLLIVDYYSRWIEFRHVTKTLASSIITAMKEIFATHGIPDVVISDNGPQYASEAFQSFAKTYGFTHTTSSPLYPQSNGAAERAVRTAKNILKKNADPYLGLIAHRTAPLYNGLSPCQLLNGRRMQGILPIRTELLKETPDKLTTSLALEKDRNNRLQQADLYNKRHRVIALPLLDNGDSVWVRDQDRMGEVVGKSGTSPRSYLVKTTMGSTIRRNRSALVHTGTNGLPDTPSDVPVVSEPTVPTTTSEQARPTGTVTRSGRIVKPNPKYST
jgi:transposase InsO family protein